MLQIKNSHHRNISISVPRGIWEHRHHELRPSDHGDRGQPQEPNVRNGHRPQHTFWGQESHSDTTYGQVSTDHLHYHLIFASRLRLLPVYCMVLVGVDSISFKLDCYVSEWKAWCRDKVRRKWQQISSTNSDEHSWNNEAKNAIVRCEYDLPWLIGIQPFDILKIKWGEVAKITLLKDLRKNGGLMNQNPLSVLTKVRPGNPDGPRRAVPNRLPRDPSARVQRLWHLQD